MASGSPADPPIDAVRSQLARVRDSRIFAGSVRLRDLLTFLVEAHLSGRERIKDIEIGAEFFGRRDFDPQASSTVRTTVNRLREALARYYDIDGQNDPVLICLPKGSYAPQFTWRPASAEVSTGADSLPSGAPMRQPVGYYVAALAVLLAAAVILAIELTVSGKLKQQPRLDRVERITFDGQPKGAPVADEMAVYFKEGIGDRCTLFSVPTSGGPPIPIQLPVAAASIEDLLPGAFLLRGANSQGQFYFWRWVPFHAPVPLEPTMSNGTIRFDVHTQIDAVRGRLRIRQSGHPERWLAVPGWAGDAVRNPVAGTIRFTVTDQGTQETSIWEIRDLQSSPRRLTQFPKNACSGRWGASGELFAFTVDGDIWIEDRHGFLTQLTRGPIRYGAVYPSTDGRTIFAVGQTGGAELARYDPHRKEFIRYLDGISAFEIDYSRDGKWMAYVLYPAGTLWKARADGTDRMQLIPPPSKAAEPHWSPDGNYIAFMSEEPGAHRRICLVPAAGGAVREIGGGPADQGVPTWLPGSEQLVFGEIRSEKPPEERRVHVVDVASGREWALPGSEGLWTPRSSPDGKSIVAISVDGTVLRLYDTVSKKWEEIAAGEGIESPVWSRDSRRIYFKAQLHTENGSTRIIRRVDVYRRMVTDVVSLDTLQPPEIGWYGITPDELPLTLRRMNLWDVYAVHFTL